MAKDIEISVDGDNWRVLSVGLTDGGWVHLHLASTTRFLEQKNGRVPAQITHAVDIPEKPGEWNRSLAGAFRKGIESAFKGYDANPYGDIRKEGGQVTWSRAYQSAWNDGLHRGFAIIKALQTPQ